jgi:hypothetical protein
VYIRVQFIYCFWKRLQGRRTIEKSKQMPPPPIIIVQIWGVVYKTWTVGGWQCTHLCLVLCFCQRNSQFFFSPRDFLFFFEFKWTVDFYLNTINIIIICSINLRICFSFYQTFVHSCRCLSLLGKWILYLSCVYDNYWRTIEKSKQMPPPIIILQLWGV